MRRALVTGGAGFIGSHLAEYLLGRGESVYVIDDLSTGRKENLAAAAQQPNFYFIEGAVEDEDRLAQVIKNVDVVYHLAASVGVKHIVQHLVESIVNNVTGTEVVLRVAARFGRKVLLTSTSEVYGRDSSRPFRETDDLRMGPPEKTRWSYACAKALDEYLAFAYFAERGLPVTVVRLFNTVGERQTDQFGMVLPTFVRQAQAQQPITIYGDGTQTRCFCHVSDVVPALVQLMEHAHTGGQVYNIGSNAEITMNALADRVIALLNSRSEKVYVPYREAYAASFDDIDRRVPDLAKINQLIGFVPQVGLDDTIQKVAAAWAVATV